MEKLQTRRPDGKATDRGDEPATDKHKAPLVADAISGAAKALERSPADDDDDPISLLRAWMLNGCGC